MFASFFAWIGRLMRRGIGKFFGVSPSAVGVSPPPPPPSGAGQFLFNLATQSGLLVLLEDI